MMITGLLLFITGLFLGIINPKKDNYTYFFMGWNSCGIFIGILNLIFHG